MNLDPAGGATPLTPSLSIPDIREYDRINAELIQLLDRGHGRIELVGAERQRMLAFGLIGSWTARIEIRGRCGPEAGAQMNAPGLTVVCHGDVADGAGREMIAGRLLVEGSAGVAVGIGQRGGSILVRGDAAERAGLRQSGGDLLLLGASGRLTSERRVGGRIRLRTGSTGLHFGWGAVGGEACFLTEEEAAALAKELDEELQASL